MLLDDQKSTEFRRRTQRRIGVGLLVAAVVAGAGGIALAAPAGSTTPAPATYPQLVAEAQRQGFDGTRSPINAWVAHCLQARGLSATYDGSTDELHLDDAAADNLVRCFEVLSSAALARTASGG